MSLDWSIARDDPINVTTFGSTATYRIFSPTTTFTIHFPREEMPVWEPLFRIGSVFWAGGVEWQVRNYYIKSEGEITAEIIEVGR